MFAAVAGELLFDVVPSRPPPTRLSKVDAPWPDCENPGLALPPGIVPLLVLP